MSCHDVFFMATFLARRHVYARLFKRAVIFFGWWQIPRTAGDDLCNDEWLRPSGGLLNFRVQLRNDYFFLSTRTSLGITSFIYWNANYFLSWYKTTFSSYVNAQKRFETSISVWFS